MYIAKSIQQVREEIKAAKQQGKTVGFVPTMGALHIGHVSLIQEAKIQTDFVVVSIFVNPTQFGPNEDFDNYPRYIDDDLNICEENGVDLVFAPSTNEMYPDKNITWVNVEGLTDKLCGSSRPDHFRGVTTVCSKLFNIVCPDIAFFGQKDAQQSIVIKRMVENLNMPLKIVVCSTVRETDGLAISSRNKYLTNTERKDAPLIYESLKKAEKLIQNSNLEYSQIVDEMKTVIGRSRLFKIDYVEILDADTLEMPNSDTLSLLVAVAANLGKARLIDNILVDVKSH
jgi:pantoate--beta-alanine ligase